MRRHALAGLLIAAGAQTPGHAAGVPVVVAATSGAAWLIRPAADADLSLTMTLTTCTAATWTLTRR